MKVGMMLGGRRKGPRTKPGKKKSSKKKSVKVKLKVSGTTEQVQGAIQKLTSGAAKGSVPVNPELQQDKI